MYSCLYYYHGLKALDIMLLVPGRLDRKIEFPLPNEEARAHILRIHSRKMNVSSDVNFEELARCTDDFNGAQLKAVCVEAGMIALRRGATELIHEDYMEGIVSTCMGVGLAPYIYAFHSFIAQEFWKYKLRRKPTLYTMRNSSVSHSYM